MAASYETLRATVFSEGAGRAGLGAALLMAKGMAAWMRGWQACTPQPPSARRPAGGPPPPEVVSVLAAMALACAEGG